MDDAKELFISIAAHKLLTPLTLIKWNLELLKKDTQMTDISKEKVKDIELSVQKLDKFSNILMKITQLKADGLNKAYKLYKVDLERILNQVAKELNVEQASKINLAEDIKGLQDLSLDENEFYYLVYALLENSTLYTENSPVINVKVAKVQNGIEIEVEDNGIGISAEEVSKIGDSFFRSSNSQKLSVKGFGLSLFICRLILKNAGGSFALESKGVGMGSKFKIFIPNYVK